jgi:hypothetical protein
MKDIFEWLKQKMAARLSREPTRTPSYLCDFDRITQEVRPGDVLLVEGKSKIAKIIRNVTNSTWTHAALYIGRLHSIDDPTIRELVMRYFKGSPSVQLLIESQIGVGTIIRPITFYKNDHLRICRPRGISRTDAQKVISNAVQHLGKQYDKRQVIDLMFFILTNPLIPSSWHTNLFRQTNPDETTKEICSSMIAEAFATVQFPIRPLAIRNNDDKLEFKEAPTKIITPKDFDYSPYFDIIKYPIYGNKGGYYKHMPWNEN